MTAKWEVVTKKRSNTRTSDRSFITWRALTTLLESSGVANRKESYEEDVGSG